MEIAKSKKGNIVFIMIIYLAGIFMGALDTGIVTPARTIIQNSLGVNEQTGIWMITIYTLAYASSIPVMGKLADRYGRKYVYLASITLFGAGSLFCGLSQHFGSFPMLVISRAFQAIGGGGILPVATAEFGTSFPKEKRGLALGLVGGVFGIANIFGASAGSAILNIFGTNNWQYIFYVNVPITLFIIVAGLFVLRNNKSDSKEKIDILGILTLVVMILSLLYGLKNIDFFHFISSVKTTDVYPFLILFVLLIPVFILIEKRACSPVMNLAYFTNRNILAVLLLSFASGIVLMGMVFVPQFCENALKIPSGSGGYLVIILGLFAGVSSPLSGRLTDKFGAKRIIGAGFAVAAAGSLFLIFVAAVHPGWLTVIISLCLIGFGIGFTMGSPINYMMLANTDEKESNSALAMASLIRSIGTTIAPAVMIGFIATAGTSVQGSIMKLLPGEIHVPELPYAKEINTELAQLKKNPQMKEQLDKINIPDLTAMSTVKIDMAGNSGKAKIPSDMLAKIQASDVTDITKNTKELAGHMFSEMSKPIMAQIKDGVQSGIDGIKQGKEQLQSALSAMQAAASQGAQTPSQTAQTPSQGAQTSSQPAQIPSQPAQAPSQPAQIPSQPAQMSPPPQTPQTGMPQGVPGTSGSLSGMGAAVTSMENTLAQLDTLSSQMGTLKKAVPGAFKTAEENYLREIDKENTKIQSVFQETLSGGFRNVYLTTAIAAIAGLLFLIFYSRKKEEMMQ